MKNKLYNRESTTKFRWVVVTLIVLPLTGVAGVAFWLVDPVAFRSAIFQPSREAVFFMKELGALTHWDKIQNISLPEPQVVNISATQEHEINIVADLYIPRNTKHAPSILLLHGSSPYGRKVGLIRLLGLYLQERGWIALAPDARGFGDTDDPVDRDDPSAWSVKTDVRRALDYLTGLTQYDGSRVFVLGHSMGANHALEGALYDPRVKGLILIGPGRYVNGEKSAVSLWNRARFSADRILEQPVSEQVAVSVRQRGNIAKLATGPLGNPQHKPILIVDGELEGDKKLQYMRKVVDEIAPPLFYHTLRETGHYVGVWSFFGSDTVYYRSDLLNPFIDMLMEFLGVQTAQAAT